MTLTLMHRPPALWTLVQWEFVKEMKDDVWEQQERGGVEGKDGTVNGGQLNFMFLCFCMFFTACILIKLYNINQRNAYIIN
jgi:hypothetical protein